MSQSTLGLVTIGNALVDVLAHADELFIKRQCRLNGMIRDSMVLIDQTRATQLYGEMPRGVETSGGSAANTVAAFASLGGKGAYIGKVADDPLGDVFKKDMCAQGVPHDTLPLKGGATGRCLVLVDEQGGRTMNTFLGAAVELSAEDIDEKIVSSAQVTYLEGYLFDPPHAKDAFRHAAKIAHAAGKKVALTLSDPFCVERHRDDFLDLVENHIDILFANEEEVKSLYRVPTFEDVIPAVTGKCEVAALTRSEKGSVILMNGLQTVLPAEPVKVVDTTGAGDAYAAGFLFGYTNGKDAQTCGRYGTIAAAEVISHMGPRPRQNLADLIRKKAA